MTEDAGRSKAIVGVSGAFRPKSSGDSNQGTAAFDLSLIPDASLYSRGIMPDIISREGGDADAGGGGDV